MALIDHEMLEKKKTVFNCKLNGIRLECHSFMNFKKSQAATQIYSKNIELIRVIINNQNYSGLIRVKMN